MKRITALFLMLGLLLCGCSFWTDGSYSSVEPHEEPSKQASDTAVTVSNYADVTAALSTWIEAGKESGMLSMQYESEERAQNDLDAAVSEVRQNNPFAAYGVDKIDYQFGTSGGRKAVSVQISYLQNRTQVDKIQRAANLQQAEQIIKQQLDACAAGVVVYFEGPELPDYVQMVADYAMDYPQRVMESPEVTVSLYPEEGEKQIVELKFSYQTSRAELRTLQNKVAPVFASAAQYVSGDWSAEEKAQRLYDFLMERYEYNIQTSITPAYSLLLHGVGDHRAFAMVYGAMCREAGLNCHLVTGTRAGTPWVWNAVQLDGEYYYIDLLNSADTGFCLYAQEEMTEYVWDYSAYPTLVEEKS
jgi:hypothetical protein